LGGYTLPSASSARLSDSTGGVAEPFQAGNIIKDSLALSSIGASSKLVATFADEDYEYQSNGVQLVDADHKARIGRS
jgi:hypothetical protein